MIYRCWLFSGSSSRLMIIAILCGRTFMISANMVDDHRYDRSDSYNKHNAISPSVIYFWVGACSCFRFSQDFNPKHDSPKQTHRNSERLSALDLP